MAYSVEKRKLGPKVQRWQEEMNREFNGTLLPAPLIRIEGTEVIDSLNVSDGQIKWVKIKSRIQQRSLMKRNEIFVKQLDAGISRCTWPDCCKTRELQSPSPTNNANSLYLCKFHLKEMKKNFTKMFLDQRVAINATEWCSPGDFEGYTALIELLESAIRKSSAHKDINNEEGRLIQDLFLNVRNFLIIVSAMISPNEELLNSFLPLIMGITLKVVQSWGQDSIKNFDFMQPFLENILFFFGIINPWDSFFPDSKPYVQIGSGLGGMVGVLSLFAVSSPLAVGVMGVGGLLGAQVGNILYINRKRKEMFERSYCRYLTFRSLHQNYQDPNTEFGDEDLNYLSGSAYVDTLLAVTLIVRVLSLLMGL